MISAKPMSTLAFEKQWNDLLGLDRDSLVDQVAANIPAKPAEMESILRFNQGRAP